MLGKILKRTVSGRGVAGEGTLICSYISSLSPFLGVQILNFNILGGGSEIMNIFFGIEYLWTLFRGHHKNGVFCVCVGGGHCSAFYDLSFVQDLGLLNF